MIQPWCDRQREALRAFRQAIIARARRERDVTDGAHSRQRATEQRYATEKARVDGEFAGGQADALARAEQTRQEIQERQTRERGKLKREYQKGKEKLQQDYDAEKTRLETEFREARWTTNTVFQADKRVAKEQMLETMSGCKRLLKK